MKVPSRRVGSNIGGVTLAGVRQDPSGDMAIGRAVEQVGGQFAEMAQRAKIKADTAMVQEQLNGLSAYANESLYGENGLYSKKGKNAIGASDRFMADFDNQVQTQLESLSDDSQRELFLAQSAKTKARLQVDSMSYQMREIQSFEETQNKAYIANLQVDAENHYQDENRVNALIQDQKNTIRLNGVVNGDSEDVIKFNQLSASSNTHVGVANRMIADGNYQGVKAHVEKYADQIFPEKRDALLSSVEKAQSAANAKTKQKLSDEITNYVAYKNSGGTEKVAYSETQLKAVYGEEQGAQVYAQIVDADQFADTFNKVQFATPEELNEIITTNKPVTPDDFSRESNQFSTLVKAIQSRSSELAKDPAKYTLSNDDVKNELDVYSSTGDGTGFAASTVSEQERLGVPSQMVTVLPKSMAESMVAEYNKGGQNAAELVQSLRQSWGDYYPQVMRDLNKAGLSNVAQVVSTLPPGNATNLLAEADQQGMKELKEFVGADDSKTITTDINDELSDLRETLAMTPNGPSTYGKLAEATNLLAHKYVSMGTPLGDAITKAANDVVNSRYEFVDGYRIPTSVRNNQINVKTVRFGVDNAVKNFKSRSLYLPSHQGMPDDVAEKVYKDNLQVTAVTMNDDSGVVFVDQNGNSILDEQTNPITMTWEELMAEGEGKEYIRVPKIGTRWLFY